MVLDACDHSIQSLTHLDDPNSSGAHDDAMMLHPEFVRRLRGHDSRVPRGGMALDCRYHGFDLLDDLEGFMHPYNDLPPKAFWKPAVGDRNMLQIEELWDPKFRISAQDKVSTYGSCFAQHIGRALKSRGFNWFRAEPAPQFMSSTNLTRFNYDVFSSRTANIYTTSLLQQWAEWAFGSKPVPEEVWEADGRFYDPFRPRIEPDGFASVEELRRSREETLRAFRQSVTDAAFFVFTLGLTERWMNTAHGYEYPMCPGTAGAPSTRASMPSTTCRLATCARNCVRRSISFERPIRSSSSS
ncbi:hypothetical protein Rumeso_04332 [Rubellimicrobium mesophilum DSM 19309]|uniref:GSCFA domain-containing protein n=1 Tax=Rubellimicrobium mesophilum DSM 19309 TaxID=442562 RepID=A0A017HJ21_9RHOB|nr:GSCFA domain-containing protein [Rubellimicrobium mesophilum]EYD74133.1 hypothetical protein Rumeso_04332 [Rubellimicrobium mesophilum DSM 19309]